MPGRDWPLLIALRLKKNVLIIAFALVPMASLVMYRLSIRSAVSKSTIAPSTMQARIASGAG